MLYDIREVQQDEANKNVRRLPQGFDATEKQRLDAVDNGVHMLFLLLALYLPDDPKNDFCLFGGRHAWYNCTRIDSGMQWT